MNFWISTESLPDLQSPSTQHTRPLILRHIRCGLAIFRFYLLLFECVDCVLPLRRFRCSNVSAVDNVALARSSLRIWIFRAAYVFILAFLVIKFGRLGFAEVVEYFRLPLVDSTSVEAHHDLFPQ